MESVELPQHRGNAQDDIEFLVSPWSRLDILNEIASAPKTRNDPNERTEVSRVTLSRILAYLEDREWIERPDRRYRLTSEGRFVADEMTRLLEKMETAAQLDGVLRWLPTDEYEFDLSRLADAEVVTLQWNDPALMRVLAEQLPGAALGKSIATGVSGEVANVVHTVTVDQGRTYEGILAGNVVEIVRHPQPAGRSKRSVKQTATRSSRTRRRHLSRY